MIKLNAPVIKENQEVYDFLQYYKLDNSILNHSFKELLLFNDNNFLEYVGLNDFLIKNKIKSISKDLIVKENICYLQYEENLFPLALKYYEGEDSLIVNSLEDNVSSSNLLDLFKEKSQSAIYKAITDKIHNRHYVYNKKEFIKSLLQFKWFDKNNIREILPEVINEIGMKEIDYTLKNGVVKKRIVPEKYMIHMSCSKSEVAKCEWEKEFPEEFLTKDLFIQGGGSGVVLSQDGNYITSFVEVFPNFIKDKDRKFSSFIRGEGSSIEEAELNAFNKVKKSKECINHDWDRRDRTNGNAFCTKCRVFNSKALPPLTSCVTCNVATTYKSINKDYYCLKHFYDLNSNILLKTEISEWSMKDYEKFHKRIYNEIRHKIKNSTFSLSRKQINQLIKHKTEEEIRPRIISFSGLTISFRYPFIDHFITKQLLSKNIVSLENIKDNRRIRALVFIYINEYSILNNTNNKYQEFFNNLENLYLDLK